MPIPHTLRAPADGAGRPLAEEVPVAIVCNAVSQAVLMATPDDLEDFATGFLIGEGLVGSPGEIRDIETVIHGTGIEVRVWLAPQAAAASAERRRNGLAPAGCGLCGIDSLDQAHRDLPRMRDTGLRIAAADIAGAPDALRRFQPLHDSTRAVHAAGFFMPGEGIVLGREDVGRHNALDKMIGGLARSGRSPAAGAAVMTSRVSLDLVQKCAVAGIPMLISVSAPTSTAVRAASDCGLTLVCNVRHGSLDILAHGTRVEDVAPTYRISRNPQMGQ
ncbi:hypothetical protein OCH239_07140 [Roseivivax halodurans JCM 10272]|uniref:Sulfur carrier protein FdhD n=1 Tax=Roseivivax halodurans JCM 10272 TaxID=1449350 RepID=X7EET8_9RHOB|nr:formate dehydrogenase accessory sulfurtransferase FdhD [Roseivivax halodurans]ETX13736.1 hypothetical protein OCH239_07140 [Roseivivax halodurans JCM 10272]